MTVKRIIYMTLFWTVTAFVLASCASDETRFRSDSTDSASIRQIAEAMNSGRKVTIEEFEKLKQILDKYPDSATVREQYSKALLQRNEWDALAKFYSAIPENERTVEEKKNLAKVLLKLGRYEEALGAAKAVGGTDDREIRLVNVTSLYSLGRYDEAKKILDDSWKDIIDSKSVGEITIRGMIYFYQKEQEKAAETLENALELSASDIPALNGLARVYSATGELEKAKLLNARLDRAYEEMTARETAQIENVDNLLKLERAYKDKKFQEVTELARELIPRADPRNKVIIYQYLINSYNALGMKTEAQAALREAQSLVQK